MSKQDWIAEWDYQPVYVSNEQPGEVTVCLTLTREPDRQVRLQLSSAEAVRLATRMMHSAELIDKRAS